MYYWVGRVGNAVFVRVLYSIVLIMIPMCPWCFPPFGVGRVSALAYTSCIILLMPCDCGITHVDIKNSLKIVI